MIVVFGSLNLDLIAWVETLPRSGQTVPAHAFRSEAGGKGGNQALAASLDGCRVAMVGSVGSDSFAEPVLERLRSAGVTLDDVAHRDGATGCALISVDGAGCNHIAVHAGANAQSRAAQLPDALLTPDTVLLLQMELPAEENAKAIRRARARGARVMLNLAPSLPMAEDALMAVDWLIVNDDEAQWLAQTLGVAPTAAGLSRRLGVGVVRTRGGSGLEAVWAEGELCLPAHAVEVVDSTAAGDCFTGVFAAGLERGLDISLALRRANAAAALACIRPGSQSSLPSAATTDGRLSGNGAL